jgi:hypothetical protein
LSLKTADYFQIQSILPKEKHVNDKESPIPSAIIWLLRVSKFMLILLASFSEVGWLCPLLLRLVIPNTKYINKSGTENNQVAQIDNL